MSRPLLLMAALAAAPLSMFAALLNGSVDLSAAQVVDALVNGTPGAAHDIVWQLRAPRVLAGFACGALLALAGTLLQVLLRNPLADPYVLGISGGAAFGALLALSLGWVLAAVNAAAFAGALAATALVYALAFRAGDWNPLRLLLTGVMLSAGFAALVSLTLVIAPQTALRGMLFWLMGDLSQPDYIGPAWAVLLLAACYALTQARRLDVLGLGLLKAASLGVAVGRLHIATYLCAAAATTAAVVLGGTIGFVGLVVPQAARLLGVTEHRWLLPIALLAGGSFLTLSDLLARVLIAPQQLPVGVLTALLGVPSMLILLSRRA
jgi:iron complex transport system permease protein